MSRKDKLIKSKSIYTIRKKHQTLSDATIYENDHVTIIRDDGIFNTDMPLFSDSNFKFRIRSGGNGKKKHNRYGWITNESSDDNVFTLSNMPENNSITDESKIVQKPNYSSLRDFAYYGSAVELVKATVNDIIMRYPAEYLIIVALMRLKFGLRVEDIFWFQMSLILIFGHQKAFLLMNWKIQ